MRATTTLAGTSLTLLLVGCSGGVRLASVPIGCTPTTSIAVTYTPGGTITVNNECINVVGGSTVTLTLSPTPPLGDARTKYTRLLGNGWLKARNDPDPGTIVIAVPDFDDDGEEGSVREFKYDIRIKGADTLDPRIVVE